MCTILVGVLIGWLILFFLFYCILFHFVLFSGRQVNSNVKCIVNAVTSVHCSSVLDPCCNYRLLFSPADYLSVSQSLWTAELNDKLLLHTSPYAQLHRLLSKCLKYHRLRSCVFARGRTIVFFSLTKAALIWVFEGQYWCCYCKTETASNKHYMLILMSIDRKKVEWHTINKKWK